MRERGRQRRERERERKSERKRASETERERERERERMRNNNRIPIVQWRKMDMLEWSNQEIMKNNSDRERGKKKIFKNMKYDVKSKNSNKSIEK